MIGLYHAIEEVFPMDYNEILKNARECSGPYCKACPVCNGMACRTQVPGPGG